MTGQQELPRAGVERETLREKGQFWTPDWVADAMVAYAVLDGSDHVFDPAVGAGAFFRATKALGGRLGRPFKLLGTEVFPDALRDARNLGLSNKDLAGIQITDFILSPPPGPFRSIVANPPYIRHHRLPTQLKGYLRTLATKVIGQPLDGRAGLHVFFLIRALERLAPGGRLAFIMPADTCEGVFAPPLWQWVTRNYRLDAVITFEPNASPFPGVDTNAIIFLVTNDNPASELWWARCGERGDVLARWTASRFEEVGLGLTVVRRDLSEALATGLSRAPARQRTGAEPVLGDFATVLRGIATGANEYFFLTAVRARELEIPRQFLKPAIGRTRDVTGDVLTTSHLKGLELGGRPTLLFSPDARMIEAFPRPVRNYLRHGEGMGLPARTLIASRRPWYKMEIRSVPPYLFAYLGRRHARFIRNDAAVVPLTGFLCVYPRRRDARFVDCLWQLLRHPATVANLPLVGKSYGGGAIKVEPRALERLPLPAELVAELGLTASMSDAQLVAL